MGSFRFCIWLSLLLFFISFQSSCLYSKKVRVGRAALLVEDVAKAAYQQSDLRTIREGMPAYLMLMDGLIEAWPDNAQLLIEAAQGYSIFSSIVGGGQDKEYINQLAGKAKDYALRSLALRGFKDPIKSSFDDFKKKVQATGKKDVSYIFWSAACWANWIILNLDSMQAMAELPRVELLIRRAQELDEGFYYGGPDLFLGIWFASRPAIAGGDLKKAQQYFLRALDFGKGKFLMSYVYYADNYARRALDKELFVSTLTKVLDTPADISPELTLVNTIAKTKAKELLSHVNEYFD